MYEKGARSLNFTKIVISVFFILLNFPQVQEIEPTHTAVLFTISAVIYNTKLCSCLPAVHFVAVLPLYNFDQFTSKISSNKIHVSEFPVKLRVCFYPAGNNNLACSPITT